MDLVRVGDDWTRLLSELIEASGLSGAPDLSEI